MIHGFFAVVSLRRRLAICTFQSAPFWLPEISSSFFFKRSISASTIRSQLHSLSSFKSTPSQFTVGVDSAKSFASAFLALALPQRHPWQYFLESLFRFLGLRSSQSSKCFWYLRIPIRVSGKLQSERRGFDPEVFVSCA